MGTLTVSEEITIRLKNRKEKGGVYTVERQMKNYFSHITDIAEYSINTNFAEKTITVAGVPRRHVENSLKRIDILDKLGYEIEEKKGARVAGTNIGASNQDLKKEIIRLKQELSKAVSGYQTQVGTLQSKNESLEESLKNLNAEIDSSKKINETYKKKLENSEKTDMSNLAGHTLREIILAGVYEKAKKLDTLNVMLGCLGDNEKTIDRILKGALNKYVDNARKLGKKYGLKIETEDDIKAGSKDSLKANSGKHLRELLSSEHRYLFTLIHKFNFEEEITKRENIIK